jgi:putative membrane protein
VEPSTNPDTKSTPSPTAPGVVNTGRPDPDELNKEQGEPTIQ